MNANLFEAIHADPWAESFVDMPALNAAVSGAIEGAVERQRDVSRMRPRDLRSHSVVVLGPPGVGKTHLFARLRGRVGPKAVFVHIRPLLSSEMTARFVLHEVVRQLGYTTTTLGLRQVDALVGSLLAHVGGAPARFPATFLEECARLEPDERARRLDEAVEAVLGIWQEADETYLRRLIALPFSSPTTQRSLLAWLSGRECDVAQLERIGATAALGEEAVVPALRTLAAVASLGAPFVIVFDQLENLVSGPEGGPRLLAYANLSAELVDSVRGAVLVHMAIDTEWERAINPALTIAQRSRIAMQRLTLALPTPKEREELLMLWGGRIANPQAPFPWPFGEQRVRRWCGTLGMTPRMLLMECRAALEEGSSDQVSEGKPPLSAAALAAPATGAADDALAAEWEKQLESARHLLDEAAQQAQCVDPARLADGFAEAATLVEGIRLEAPQMREVVQFTFHTSVGQVRMALLHQTHHRSLGATLSKLALLADTEVVLAVRERARDLAPTWKDTLAKRAAFIAKPNARWIALERDEAARLLALASIVGAARSGDVTDEAGRPVAVVAVEDWVKRSLDLASLPILKAILQGRAEQASEERSVDDRPAPAPARSHTALGVLVRLRVASLDRLVREVARVDSSVTRASTLLELEHHQHRVRWIGSTIVCLKGGEP
jgi:hypothetical protein